VSSLSPPRCRLSSGRRHYATALCHPSFPLNQDELAASASSFGIALSPHLPSQAKTEVLNLHHRHRLPFSDRLTPTLHCYRKIIPTLTTLPTTQTHLNFASSLARAPRHWSSTRRCRSLSPWSHAHYLSAQRHPW
jgi:hypothetical protein